MVNISFVLFVSLHSHPPYRGGLGVSKKSLHIIPQDNIEAKSLCIKYIYANYPPPIKVVIIKVLWAYWLFCFIWVLFYSLGTRISQLLLILFTTKSLPNIS